MNCDDYLAMLATLPVDELAYGSAREHAATCRDCNRVTRVVAERERNMLTAYTNLDASASAVQVAAEATRTSSRQRRARLYKFGLGIAAAATVVFMMRSRFLPAPQHYVDEVVVAPVVGAPAPEPLISETFHLRCLSAQTAAVLLRPYVGRTTSLTMRPGEPRSLEIWGTLEEIQAARSVLDGHDIPGQTRCELTSVVPGIVPNRAPPSMVPS